MGLIVSTKGVDVSENTYINKVGHFLLEVKSVKEDGFANDGSIKIKMGFEGFEISKDENDKPIIINEPKFAHFEDFILSENGIKFLKRLEIALKAPETYDIYDFIGRKVIAKTYLNTYTKKDGTQGQNYKIGGWSYSKSNDSLPPIKEKFEVAESSGVELTEDEIPDDFVF